MLAAAWGLSQTRSHWPGPYDDLAMGDPDQARIGSHLAATHTLAQVLHWFHGPWVGAPELVFYRPVPSVIWWLLLQLGGPRPWLFVGVLLASHLVACVVLLCFLRDLIGTKLATLSVILWAGLLEEQLTLPSPRDALYRWKDAVEPWTLLAILFTLWPFLRALRSEKTSTYWLAILAFLVALATKEMTYTVPLLLLGLLVFEGRPSKWKATLPFFVMTAAAFAFRTWALGGFGTKFGSNRDWAFRLGVNAGGWPFIEMFGHDFLPLALTLLVAAVFYARRGARRLAGSLAAGAVALICLTDLWRAGYLGDAFLRLIGTGPWLDAILFLIFGALWWSCFALRDRVQLLGAGCFFISYLPLLTMSNSPHVLYIPSIGWAIWLAPPCQRLLDWTCRTFMNLRARPGMVLEADRT